MNASSNTSRRCAGVAKAFSSSIDVPAAGKCVASSAAWRDGRPSRSQSERRQRIGEIRSEALQDVVDETPLHLRRDPARLLVDRHDASRVDRLALAFLIVEKLVLRVGQLQAARCDARRPRRRAPRAGPPSGRRGGTAGSARSRECWPVGSPTSASKILKPGRRVDRTPELRIRPVMDAARPGEATAIGCEPASVLVAQGKAVEQVFDGVKTALREIGRPPWSDALQILERGREQRIGVRHERPRSERQG